MTNAELVVLRNLALDPTTPPARLAELVLHKNDTINRLVVENPNSLAETVLPLASAHPIAFLQNPALIMWALALRWLRVWALESRKGSSRS